MNVVEHRESAKAFVWTATADEGESLWARWSRFCLLNRPSLQELSELLPSVPSTRQMFATDWNKDPTHRAQAAQVRALLSWSQAEFSRGVGSELAAGTTSGHIVCSALRYCPMCLADGFHSPLFQHWAVSGCWKHDVPLVDRCTQCHQPIQATFALAAASPFGCPHCGSAFFTECAILRSRNIAGDMRALRESVSIANAKATSLWAPEEPVQAEAQRVRSARRIGLWGDWRPPVERQCRLVDVSEDMDPARLALPLRRAQRDLWTFLHRVYAPWSREIAELERTMNAKIYWPTAENQSGISVVAANAFQLRYLYDAPSPYRRRPRSSGVCDAEAADGSFSMHGTPLVWSPEGNAALYRYEVLGLACALLIKAAFEPDKVAERWCTAPAREWYCPTWRLERRGGAWVLRIRPKGGIALLRWLINRYRDRRIDLLSLSTR